MYATLLERQSELLRLDVKRTELRNTLEEMRQAEERDRLNWETAARQRENEVCYAC